MIYIQNIQKKNKKEKKKLPKKSCHYTVTEHHTKPALTVVSVLKQVLCQTKKGNFDNPAA